MSHAPAQPLGMLWPLHQGTQTGLGCKDNLISGPTRPQPHRAILQAEVQDGVSFLIAFGYFCCSPDMDRVRNPDPGTLGGGHRRDTLQTATKPSVPHAALCIQPGAQQPCRMDPPQLSREAMQSPKSRTAKKLQKRAPNQLEAPSSRTGGCSSPKVPFGITPPPCW